MLGHIEALHPQLLVVDSVQTMSTPDADGAPGGVTQTRAVTVALTGLAKERGLPVLLVGHVTKDGSIAGPRVLEHLVDVVLAFEGDRHSTLRMVRGVKNRFGPADEVGCFELRDAGIVGMPDPSGLFLARFDGPPVPGTAVTVVLDGRRPLPAELQALVTGKDIPSPRRAVSGLDNARVAMLLAVLQKRAGLRLHDAEVYAATVGGMRVLEPAADLALALAIASARRDVALPPDVVVLGEIGLAGEVRRVAGAGPAAGRGRPAGLHPRPGPAGRRPAPARDEDHRGARHRRRARRHPLTSAAHATGPHARSSRAGSARGGWGAGRRASWARAGATALRSRPGSPWRARPVEVSAAPGASARQARDTSSNLRTTRSTSDGRQLDVDVGDRAGGDARCGAATRRRSARPRPPSAACRPGRRPAKRRAARRSPPRRSAGAGANSPAPPAASCPNTPSRMPSCSSTT